MSYKTIFAPMIFEDTSRVVVEAALQIAGVSRGHVIAKHIRQIYNYYPPMAYSSMVALNPYRPDQVIHEASLAFAEGQKALFEEICAEAGAHVVAHREAPRKRGVTASWSDEHGIIPDSLGRSARIADLSITAIPGKDGGIPEVNLIENLLVSSGKGVLLVPRAGLAKYPERVLICWDGSRSAARAIDAAFGFLKSAKSVRMITLKAVDLDTPKLDEAASYLGLHGLTVETDLIARPKGATGKRILDEARNFGSDLIVMGGYSHRRFDEAIFGGVTRYLLNHSERPILMAH